MDFFERQRELCLLASFINDQEKWLDSVLDQLQWTRDNLNSDNARLEQCPHNPNHFVPSASLEAHKVKCWYSSALGTEVDSEAVQKLVCGSNFYAGTNIARLEIDRVTEKAVVKLAEQVEMENSNKHQANTSNGTVKPVAVETNKYSASIEDTRITPPELLTQPAHQIISYIKSWQRIPKDFLSVSVSSLELAEVKGWLFKNLPEKHIHSSSLGGEMVTVETIMKWLFPSESPESVCPSPDSLVEKLKPMLGWKSKSFVLDLWKYIHISRLQSQHGIEDSFVDDIVPLTAAAILHLPEEEEGAPTVSEKVKELLMTGAVEDDGSTSLPLPMDHVFYQFTPKERKMLYDYTVEVTNSEQGPSSKLKEFDPELYRDDTAALKAKLKAQKNLPTPGDSEENSVNYLEQLKRKRDYRRRRQAYRAKNVHITRRTPREVFRDIISGRMEEIAAAASEGAERNGQNIDGDSVVLKEVAKISSHGYQEKRQTRDERSRSPKIDRERSFRELKYEDEDSRSEREKGSRRHRKSRSRSRSTSRSRSKERHRKHKKHRSRDRSHSRDRSSRHKRKLKHHRHRSRSKSPTKD